MVSIADVSATVRNLIWLVFGCRSEPVSKHSGIEELEQHINRIASRAGGRSIQAFGSSPPLDLLKKSKSKKERYQILKLK